MELDYRSGHDGLRYWFSFGDVAGRFQLIDERLESCKPARGKVKPFFYFGYENGRPMLNVKGARRELRREDVHPEQSILAQRKDPDQYPEITWVAERLTQVRIYRDWSFGRFTPPRLPQPPDRPNNFLEEDCRNLGLVLNRFRREPQAKLSFLEALDRLYQGIDDFDVIVEGGTVQVFLQEDGRTIPATRLSDGTLRYLCLHAILLHPTPPPLVCLEEPELGLHPDVLPFLADLLRRASERMQIIVTTHSDTLVDAMTETPESVVVCEKHDGATHLKRLDASQLSEWLERYTLGQLWRKGEVGGNP